jgi:RNA polymerase sigma factor (sigma-70 family)
LARIAGVPAIDFPATRWSLIARLPEQPRAVATVLALYADAIGAYVSRKLVGESPERVADIVQEVLLELLGKPDLLAQAQPGTGSRFRHYLMHLAWMAARNHLRYARRRDHAGLDAIGDGPAAESGQQAAMDRAWALSVVQQSLDQLRRWAADGTLEPEAFAVLTGSLIEGRDLRSLSAASGLSLATCSRRLARARTLLQQTITERLRLAGELAADEDPAAACAVLLAAVAER